LSGRIDVGQRMIGTLWHSQRGAVGVIGALMIPLMLGLGGFVAEYGNALVVRTDNQRVADAAAYAGALAYSNTATVAAATDAVNRVVAYNGIPATIMKGAIAVPTTTVAVGASPTGNGTAVQVSISTDVPLFFTRFIAKSGATTQAVPVTAYAELRGSTPACIVALSKTVTYGVSMSGGTKVEAPDCAVAAAATYSLTGGPTLTAKAVAYGTSAPSLSGGAVINGSDHTPSSAKIINSAPTDPLTGSTEVSALTGRVAGVKSMTAPGAPTAVSVAAVTGGSNFNFQYTSQAQQQAGMPAGCTVTGNGGTWNVSCTQSTINIAQFQFGGGMTINFNIGKAATYNFSQGLSTSGGTNVNFGGGSYTFNGDVSLQSATTFGAISAFKVRGNLTTSTTMNFGSGDYTVTGNMTLTQPTTFGNGNFNVGGDILGRSTTSFGNGTFNVVGGINNSGGTPMTFGYGTFAVGTLNASCDSDRPSICALSSGATSFGTSGSTSSSFALQSGVSAGGGATVRFGAGTGNSFRSGTSSAGNYSLRVLGGAVMSITLGDLAANTGAFEVTGAIVDDGGGSCLVLGEAPNHDIAKSISGAGAIVMGAGNYTIGKYMWMGASNGGNSSNCPGYAGQSIGVLAKKVSIYIDGSGMPGGSTCSAYAFCVGAGYSAVTIYGPDAPTLPATSARLAIVSAPSSGTAGAYFFAGSALAVVGTVYIPNGPVRMDGGASLADPPAGGCLTFIADTFTLSGGTTAASSCSSGLVKQTAVLVQ